MNRLKIVYCWWRGHSVAWTKDIIPDLVCTRCGKDLGWYR